ncbi:MAG: SusD/RagB family nutrient-binding outer membrane lipoprotein [Cyclobacteriaceae bacterium]|nr:SusD/RagB family nutrient-binding outer membrane lipoprotein [Cyclobacteriaceae bacterium]
MKDILKKFGFLVLLVTTVTSCDLDGDLENPNQITVSGADVDLIMNGIQLDFADFFNAAHDRVNPLVRMEAMTGGFRYQTANSPQDANGVWSSAYEDVLVNAETMITLAEEKGLTTHIAVGKILSAYVYLTLVDVFGDVPRTEALKGGEGNFNPVADGGESVYDYAITLLDEARTELAKTGTAAGGALSRDIYYGGNRARWNALANTLELKAQLNLSQVPARKAGADARITALLTADLVDTEAENFTYKYSSTTVPVSRHPLYRQYYDPIRGQAGGYIANYFLYELFQGKVDPVDPAVTVQDPRWRYYFYRQVGSIAQALAVDPKSLGCAPGAPPQHYIDQGVKMFCVFDPGFYGRDHGDGFGIPPDGPVLTAAGVYPAGGKIDNTAVTNATFVGTTIQGDGANGAGIQPIFMSWFTDFMRAEFLARNGDAAGAKTAMNDGINKSITQIRNFATSKAQVLSPGREPSTTAYLAAVNFVYDNAANKLDVIGKEFYISAWGNGVEAYNIYRRTSAPRDLQPTLQTNPGPFYRSYVYPATYVNLNDNASQKDFNATNKVFWDTNPDDLK